MHLLKDFQRKGSLQKHGEYLLRRYHYAHKNVHPRLRQPHAEVNFPCVDEGFGQNKPVDVVIRPEDIDLLKPGQGSIDGVVTHMIFKGVHYEMEVMANNYEWLVHSTDMFPVGTEVSIHVDPFDIQIMKKPESEDEEAVNIEE